MARPSGPKDHCGGRWTAARKRAFIISLLRQGTRRWAPITDVLKRARTRRGFYLCAGCGKEVPSTVVKEGKRVKNVAVDHRDPVVSPETGFVDWDTYIERMFCEEDNLDLLCLDCHTEKSNDERERAKQRRQTEKENKEDND